MSPNIGAVMRHIDGNVADNLNAKSVRVSPQFLPLPREFILPKFVYLNLVRKPDTPLPKRIRLPIRDVSRPARPRDQRMSLLTSHEEGKVLEPASVRLAEFLERCVLGGIGRLQKILSRPLQ